MIPLYLGEIWATNPIFLLPWKLKRSHNRCCIWCWSCCRPSGPSGCFAGEALRSRDKLCRGCCQAQSLGCLCGACTLLLSPCKDSTGSSTANSEMSVQECMDICAKICLAMEGCASTQPKRWECAWGNWNRVTRYPWLWMTLHEGLK